MAKDKVSVYEKVTDQIIKRLEAGTVPWRMPWTTRRPRNIISNKPYRGINVFMVAMSAMENDYSSPYWMSFKQMVGLGGHLKKDQHGTMVIYWGEGKSKDLDEDGKPLPYHFLTYSWVFNLDQTEGVKVPKREADQPRAEVNPIDAAEAIVAGYPNPPKIKENGTAAVYNPTTDVISIPPMSAHLSVEEFYSTKFHEMAHSTGHTSRLDRFQDGKFGSHAYGREELIAEMTNAFLCGEAGIELATIDNSAAYLASWIKTIKEDTQAVVRAAAAAQKAADLILDRVPAMELAA